MFLMNESFDGDKFASGIGPDFVVIEWLYDSVLKDIGYVRIIVDREVTKPKIRITFIFPKDDSELSEFSSGNA
jgi:hypothetical protein